MDAPVNPLHGQGDSGVPEGMMEVWTVENAEHEPGVFVADFRLSREEALAECGRRSGTWGTRKLVVPYGETTNA